MTWTEIATTAGDYGRGSGAGGLLRTTKPPATNPVDSPRIRLNTGASRTAAVTSDTATAFRLPSVQHQILSPFFSSPAARNPPASSATGWVSVVASLSPSTRSSSSRFRVRNTPVTFTAAALPSAATPVTRSPSRSFSIGVVPAGVRTAVPAGKQPGWHGGGWGCTGIGKPITWRTSPPASRTSSRPPPPSVATRDRRLVSFGPRSSNRLRPTSLATSFRVTSTVTTGAGLPGAGSPKRSNAGAVGSRVRVPDSPSPSRHFSPTRCTAALLSGSAKSVENTAESNVLSGGRGRLLAPGDAEKARPAGELGGQAGVRADRVVLAVECVDSADMDTLRGSDVPEVVDPLRPGQRIHDLDRSLGKHVPVLALDVTR